MNAIASFIGPTERSGALLVEVNERLSAAGLSLTQDDARMLAERRVDALVETERVEFGTPAVAAIAETVSGSPYLARENVAMVLAELQDAFYALRDELPVDVPDSEIVEALQRGFDAHGGNLAEVLSLPKDEVMSYSEEYRIQSSARKQEAYCIIDDEGRKYVFDPAEWDYDEQADGWDGERWSDGFGD